MNIPQISSIDTAIEIYYRYPELTTREIERLFTKHSKSTINRLKMLAKRRMYEQNIFTHGIHKLNTECAYTAWGIDIQDLERRRAKLNQLGL